MEAFLAEDRAKDERDLDLRHDSLPAQRSLGVFWDLETDAFTFKVSLPEKPFTRRGVLSVVNSVYDPLGFVVPVMLEGRKILQELVHMGERTKENNTPSGLGRPPPYRDDKSVDALERLSRRVAEPFRASLLPPKRVRQHDKSGATRLFRRKSGCYRSRSLPSPVQRSERGVYSSRQRASKSRPVKSDEHTASRTVRSGLSCSSRPESYKRNRSEDF